MENCVLASVCLPPKPTIAAESRSPRMVFPVTSFTYPTALQSPSSRISLSTRNQRTPLAGYSSLGYYVVSVSYLRSYDSVSHMLTWKHPRHDEASVLRKRSTDPIGAPCRPLFLTILRSPPIRYLGASDVWSEQLIHQGRCLQDLNAFGCHWLSSRYPPQNPVNINAWTPDRHVTRANDLIVPCHLASPPSSPYAHQLAEGEKPTCRAQQRVQLGRGNVSKRLVVTWPVDRMPAAFTTFFIIFSRTSNPRFG